MKWWKKPWVLPVLLAIVIVMGSNWYIRQIMQEDIVSKEDVKARLELMYQGSVERLTEGDAGYEAEILRNGALYGAIVDHKTGKVLALTLLKEAEPKVEVAEKPVEHEENKLAGTAAAPTESTPEPSTVPQTDQQKPAPAPASTPKPVEKPKSQPQPKPAPKKSVILTEQQVANIALGQLNAKVPVEVDDIDFVETQQGGYYLVELDLDTDADLDEVVYQIHAISGKVISVSWDN